MEFSTIVIIIAVVVIVFYSLIKKGVIEAREAEVKRQEDEIRREEQKKKRKEEERNYREKEKLRIAEAKRKIEAEKQQREKERLEEKEAILKANEKRKSDLVEEYGKKIGSAVFSKRVVLGMSKKMVRESMGKAKYEGSDKWYYGKKRFDKCIQFEKHMVVKHSKCDDIWLDMPRAALIASYGKPDDEKKTVTKKSVKLRLYYGWRVTRQMTKAYKFEVRLDNDLVVGWKELE